MHTQDTNENSAVRLARYLREFVGLKSTVIRDVDKYEQQPLWFGNMPQDTDCLSPFWALNEAPDTPWLQVRRQHFPPPPFPPELLAPWLDDTDVMTASEEPPSLRNVILSPGEHEDDAASEHQPATELNLEDHPEVRSTYDEYLPKWIDWSKEYRRKEAIQKVYSQLFRLHTQVIKQGEVLELVLGLGLLDWFERKDSSFYAVRRHIVTTRVELRFDSANGIISVVPPGEGADLKIEDDMLEAEHRPQRSVYDATEMQLSELGDNIFGSGVHEALKTWAGALADYTEYSEGLPPQRRTGHSPVTSFSPALILRKRTQAGMLRIYDELIQQLSNSDEIPDGWRQLVVDMDDHAPDTDYDSSAVAEKATRPDSQDIFFPLPANRQQRAIIESIRDKRGVLVQGPPGTGKSHTIANLMCHLLATGKRLLVTAENARALQVLKEKLPQGLQPLCVSFLGQGSDSFAELNAAVQGITSRQASYMEGAYEETILDLEEQLDARRRRIAALDNEILSLREGETVEHSLCDGRYRGTPSAIAARVSDECTKLGWLEIPAESPTSPPTTNEEMLELLAIYRRFDGDAFSNAKRAIPDSKELPPPEIFTELVATEHKASIAVNATSQAKQHTAYYALGNLSASQRETLQEWLVDIERRRNKLLRVNNDWIRLAIQESLAERRAKWQSLLERSKKALAELESLVSQLGRRTVSHSQELNPLKMRSDALAAISYLSKGGKWKRFGIITPKPLAERTYLTVDVFVDGNAARTIEDLQTVCDWITRNELLQELYTLWSFAGFELENSDIQICIAIHRENIAKLEATLTYEERCRKLARRMVSNTPPVPEPDWLNGDVADWVEVLNALELEDKRAEARACIDSLSNTFRSIHETGNAHDVVGLVESAITERDTIKYQSSYDEVIAIETIRSAAERRDGIGRKLTNLTGLIDLVRQTATETYWDTRFASWTLAWHWCHAEHWLKRREDNSVRHELWKERQTEASEIANTIAELAEFKAWTHFLDRLTKPESAALKGWKQTMAKMPKGTSRSKGAARLKQRAREYMAGCRDAIPVWIMPRYLVAEMIDMAPGRFDLVIVDESSQLGIESLFLFYIAKKMIVVGDDQQISPAGVGISIEAIGSLQDHYLKDIRHKAVLDPKSSLYDNAMIRFGRSIVLREHFRCMPEIIQFSNDLCYAPNGTPLDPIRTYSGNRLKPLVVRHVPDGYRKGSSQYAQNPPEADAIVAQIAACIADPRYSPIIEGETAKLTIGVISLQGEAQAQLIEQKLLKSIEPQEIRDRRIICGDAYAFQGDERHVIFLSMVAAVGDTRITALTSKDARQRFNVAASRARDQLWLYHSVHLEELKPNCMRRALLAYMLDPGRKTIDENSQVFDSDFERKVYRMIADRGFHVRTQVRIGDPSSHRYRIDLVIEGMRGQLAVECDGDHWHGADRYEQDMARQRDLERVGWTFVRIRGGDFYRDPANAMQPLWTELDRLGILPGGIDTAAAEPPDPVVNSVIRVFGTADGEDNESEAFGTDDSLEDDFSDESSSKDEDVESGKGEAEIELELNNVGISENILATNDLTPVKISIVSKEQHTDGLQLAPYEAYQGDAGPDPRVGEIDDVAAWLVAIIDVEGPMLAKRAYTVYLRGCGIKRMGHELKRTMNRALQRAIRDGHIEKVDEHQKGGLLYSIVRAHGAPSVRVRERGPRSIGEIPPSELSVIATKLANTVKATPGSEEHMKAILDSLGLKRLTTQVSVLLSEVIERDFGLDEGESDSQRHIVEAEWRD